MGNTQPSNASGLPGSSDSSIQLSSNNEAEFRAMIEAGLPLQHSDGGMTIENTRRLRALNRGGQAMGKKQLIAAAKATARGV